VHVIAHLWDRVSGTQALPPAWLIGLTGIAALLLVLNTRIWLWAGKVITIAHEGGHALISVLSGRRLDGIRLHADSSGVTYSRGKRNGPGLVLTAAAGYLMPSLLGAGAAWLLAEQHLTAMLWLALVLLAATFLAIRNVFGEHATAKGKFAISSTKSVTGHLLGAAGGVEAIFSVMALRDGIMPPTMNLVDVDPEIAALGMDLVPNKAEKADINVVVSNSFGFGGTNGTLVFRRV